MGAMSNMELPDRTAVLGHVADLMARHRATSEHGRATDGRPALLVVHVEGYPALCARDPLGGEAAMRDVARRLDRLVRSGDLLIDGSLRTKLERLETDLTN
mgnify:CR=1 FL=1